MASQGWSEVYVVVVGRFTGFPNCCLQNSLQNPFSGHVFLQRHGMRGRFKLHLESVLSYIVNDFFANN